MKTTTNRTILLLISGPIVRLVITETLQHGGYMVVSAADLGTAVERLTEFRPDLLIIRSYVESIPGYDAATFLRTKCPGLPVLMVGGQIDDNRLHYRMSLKGFEVFPKPFPIAALLEKVKDVLESVHQHNL